MEWAVVRRAVGEITEYDSTRVDTCKEPVLYSIHSNDGSSVNDIEAPTFANTRPVKVDHPDVAVVEVFVGLEPVP